MQAQFNVVLLCLVYGQQNTSMTFSITTMYLYSFYVASIGNNPATLLACRTRNDTRFHRLSFIQGNSAFDHT
jgi:hypothetical protein